MAWYKWLAEDMTDPVWKIEWPELGEVRRMENLGKDNRGFHVYSGSRVASYIPWRYTPVDLYQVETDGEYITEDGNVYFSEVTPVEKKGTLRRDAAPEVALAWLDLLLDARFASSYLTQADVIWNKQQIMYARDLIAAKVAGGDGEGLMDKARISGESIVVYAASSVMAKTPDQAWSYCLQLAHEAKHPQLGIEFARALEKSMNGELCPN